MASDSQATAATSGQPTKQYADKIFVLDSALGWGSAGSVGLAQRIHYRLEQQAKLGKNIGSCSAPLEAAQRLCQIVNKVQREAAEAFIKEIGGQPESCTSLIAGYCSKDQPFILEIAANGGSQLQGAYAAIGSGDIFATYAIRSVAHFDVPNLGIEHAKALAFRTVADAINTAAYGLGGNVQMVAVTPRGANMLSATEIESVQDSVTIWKAKEVETLGSLGEAVSKPADEPPTE